VAIRHEDKPVVRKEEESVDANNYSETLSDIDEDEINQFILTPIESSLKSLLWHHIHKEWIEKQKLKEGIYLSKEFRFKKKKHRKSKERKKQSEEATEKDKRIN